MIQLTPQMRIVVAVEPTEFRKGIDGLAQVCKEVLKRDSFASRSTSNSARGLSRFLCQPGRVRYLLVSSGSRLSNMMAKWLSASFQCRTGIVHRPDASRIAM